jgi:flavodoxin
MKALVVYDSVYGNTEKIAQAIGDALSGDVQVLRTGQVSVADLEAVDLLFIGSPTHGSLPSEAMQTLLQKIGAPVREGAKAAAFDTRLSWGFLRRYGFAALKIADALNEKGWILAVAPEGFVVGGLRKGPLKRGELERAAAWARDIVGSTK